MAVKEKRHEDRLQELGELQRRGLPWLVRKPAT